MENLTSIQKDLVNNLIQQFNTINPQPISGKKRFTIQTINQCNDEEKLFQKTISAHNLTMVKVLCAKIQEEIKAFKKEFGEVIDTQIGHNEYNRPYETIELMSESVKNDPLVVKKSNEATIFLVSKKKLYNEDSRFDYCNNMKYYQIFVSFRTEKAKQQLESGKEVIADKIIGLSYSRFDWLHRVKFYNAATLDELIQNDDEVQKALVSLVH